MNNTVAVIGGGPGGYAAAIRLHQKGIKTVLFEKDKLGGECLNWGCIPTKAMVKAAEMFNEVNRMPEFGINPQGVTLDFERLMERKDEVVDKLTGGLQAIFQKRKIPLVFAEVKTISKENDYFKIRTVPGDVYFFSYVVIATGSISAELPDLKIDSQHFLSSRDIVKLSKLPQHLTIIGGGTIGCEFASIFANLGVKVDIVEMMPTLLPYEDKEIVRKLMMSFKKKKINVHRNTMIETAQLRNGKVELITNKGRNIFSDVVLIATGRNPYCSIEFEDLHPACRKGSIVIDNLMETSEDDLFAIGDVTGKLMLAHTATKQGLLVADVIVGRIDEKDKRQQGESPQKAETQTGLETGKNAGGIKVVPENLHYLNYDNIPRCTFTDPEVASVGLTEQQALDTRQEILVGRFSYMANGKALASGQENGMIKVIGDKKDGSLLGMHIMGAAATELIALGSIILNANLSLRQLEKVVYAHPTISEVVMEAIEDLEGRAVHKI